MPFQTFDGRISTKESRLNALSEKGTSDESCFKPYISNTAKEQECNDYLQELEIDFVTNNPEWRGRLYLTALNEYGVKKVVCSTLRPTLSNNSEFHDVRQANKLLSQFLSFEPLENHKKPPNFLPSPTSVLESRVGDAFDYATVLASFLLGAAYDAYVVYGEAPQWICQNDQQRCVLSEGQDCINEATLSLKSGLACFESNDDDATGVHCWVFIRAEARVPGMFYLEPTTGNIFSPCDAPYTKIYSIWNDKNIWIHTPMEIRGASFDLSDAKRWQPVFVSNVGESKQNKPNITRPPQSWVAPLSLDPRAIYQGSFRQCVLYNKAKLELFGNHENKYHLFQRKTFFEDDAMSNVQTCYEYFKENNPLKLQERVRYPKQMRLLEKYFPGHKSAIKEWSEESGKHRKVTFYPGTRLDGLISRIEIFGESVTETFRDRYDSLTSRCLHVRESSENQTKAMRLPGLRGNKDLIIVNMIETYEACAGINKHSIAKRTFIPGKGQIVIEYFPPDDRSLPKITTLCRSDVNDKEIDPVWADASLAEKKILDSARKLHNEISAVIEEATSVYTNYENKNRLTPRMVPNKKIQEENESDESDWLAPYIRARGMDPQGELTNHEEILLDCLQDLNERLDGREHIIRSRIEEETANISQLNARLRKCKDIERPHTEEPEHLEVADVLKKKEESETQLKVLQKRLDAHENLVQSKREALELKIKSDPRFELLLDDDS
mmetsp:Transcript_1607/g.2356  ORF Transcript_1607/g.2356 Transcript_1607/m.2356 type:complete len:724 (-) Transcript_1607:1998-4169(-)